MNRPTARQLAISALARVDQGAPVQEVMADLLPVLPSQRDRNLCTDLVYGLLRMNLRVDYILSRLLSAPHKLPAPMYHALELGIYGLLCQSRIPAYATINETVKITGQHFGQGLAKVANAVLRAFQRLGNAPHEIDWYGADNADRTLRACIYYSIPESIARIWRKDYGEEAALLLMRRSARRPRTGIRINLRHPQAQELLAEAKSLQSDSLKLVGRAGIAFAPGEIPAEFMGKPLQQWQAEGAMNWQSPGSMLILEKLGLDRWKADVWDCCAGAGGKTAALIEAGVPVRLATDMSRKRLSRLCACYCHSGMPGIVVGDCLRPPLSAWHGNILVDAPCSGLGILARRPDIRKRFQQKVSGMPDYDQMGILDRCVRLLEPGRQLAYVTCTLRRRENEEMVARILKKHENLALMTQWQTPHDHPWLEGMFGAVLEMRPLSGKVWA